MILVPVPCWYIISDIQIDASSPFVYVLQVLVVDGFVSPVVEGSSSDDGVNVWKKL